jgi:hypothetical protein
VFSATYVGCLPVVNPAELSIHRQTSGLCSRCKRAELPRHGMRLPIFVALAQ